MKINTAKEVLDLYWDGYLPVDPVEIARNMGVKIKPSPFLDHSGHFYFENEQPTIEYCSSEPERRRRFTIAHELGHFVNGDTNAPRDTSRSFDRYNYDPREVNANRFAADLLMPEYAINYLINIKNIKTLEELADKFHVSTGAMHYRLVNLGII